MAGIRFGFSVAGKPQFDRTFIRYGAVFDDLTPVWKEVQQEFYSIEADQFQSGGAAGASGKWQPLSPRYEAQKIARYGTFALLAGVLIASNRMYESLTGETGDSVVEIGKQEAVFGTKLPYAKYHQRGGGRLPRREVISFSEKQKLRMQKRIQRKLVELLRKGNGGLSSLSSDVET